MTDWVKQNISSFELKSNEKTYLILDVWVRQFSDYFETILLIKNFESDMYLLKYNGNIIKNSIKEIIKNWRSISYNNGIIKYEQSINININIDNARQIGKEFETYEKARNKLHNYIS